eukprot:CAMPEP_0174947506 /NCGR_PEP_ID=MMETSP1355-20121228/86761_1 /TAXON_ID=464990 /ORGANISM="Hemiselmis tepida, Strain CCMP443" /LENGTH=58 /DNA_ID=CAMNT_0016194981 /DNA_START=287 /DNA_END=462 /DNA_ORIENTATION=+
MALHSSVVIVTLADAGMVCDVELARRLCNSNCGWKRKGNFSSDAVHLTRLERPQYRLH